MHQRSVVDVAWAYSGKVMADLQIDENLARIWVLLEQANDYASRDLENGPILEPRS